MAASQGADPKMKRAFGRRRPAQMIAIATNNSMAAHNGLATECCVSDIAVPEDSAIGIVMKFSQ
jgi:hypothetical protein